MQAEDDPERALERIGDELEERKQRLDEQLDEARALLADRAREARHLDESMDALESDPARPADEARGAGA